MPDNTPNEPMFTPSQLNSLKTLAVAGILGGSTFATLPFLRPGRLLSSKTQAIGSPMVEVPVPGQEQLPNSSEFFQKIRKSKAKGRGKKLQPFKPSENVAVEEKSAALGLKDLTNPYLLPALGLAGGVPAVGSYYLLNKLFRNKIKKDHLQELEDAKREFGEALVEAHSNRLNQPVTISKPNLNKAASAESTLAEDLEKLASLCLEKKAEVPEYKPSPVGALSKTIGNLASTGAGVLNKGVGALGQGAEWLNKFVENVPSIAKGTLGAAGLLALITGAAGTYDGYRGAAKADDEKLQSERYLNEFLSRRHAEGMPIQSVPVPVKVNKNMGIKPIGDVTKKLDSEA